MSRFLSKVLVAGVLASSSFLAHADHLGTWKTHVKFQCSQKTDDGVTHKIEVDATQVTYTTTSSENQNEKYSFNNTFSTWDGHIAGTVSGRGVFITFENHYGMIRNIDMQLATYSQDPSKPKDFLGPQVTHLTFEKCGKGQSGYPYQDHSEL